MATKRNKPSEQDRETYGRRASISDTVKSEHQQSTSTEIIVPSTSAYNFAVVDDKPIELDRFVNQTKARSKSD